MYYDQLGQRDRFSPKAFFGARGLPVPEGMPDTFASDDDEVYDQAQLSFAPEPADVPAEYLNAKLFHLASRYYGKHQRSLAFLRKHGIQVTLDPGIWYMRQEDEARVAALFKDVDYLLPSKEEVQALLGDVDLVQAAKRLASFGPRVRRHQSGQGRLHCVRPHVGSTGESPGLSRSSERSNGCRGLLLRWVHGRHRGDRRSGHRGYVWYGFGFVYRGRIWRLPRIAVHARACT